VVITSLATVDSSILLGSGTANFILGFTNGALFEGSKSIIRVTLPVSSTNYVYMNNSGLFAYGSSVPSANITLYQITTDTINITASLDLRVFGTEKNIHISESPLRMERGTHTFASILSGATGTTVITFPRPFTDINSIYMYFGCEGGAGQDGSGFSVGSSTLTTAISFTLNCKNNGSSATGIVTNWLAFGR
jgi:hypothetical protein